MIAKRIRLGEIASFRNGLNYSRESFGTGCKVIGVTSFKDRLIPDYEALEEINPDGVVSKNDYLKSGDVVFVRSNGNKALVGRSLFIEKDESIAISGFCIRARLHDARLSPKYFAYFTKTDFFKRSIGHTASTSINNLNQGVLADVEVPVPSIEDQSRIVFALDAIQEKITLNNKINAELEAMAKLIYDYWFVQFDFPDENGDPYKSSGGKMVWCDQLKRGIPEGWEPTTLEEFVLVKKGTLITEETANTHGDIKVVSAGIGFSYFHDKANFPENTVTVSASGASAGFINYWHEPIFANDCTVVRGDTLAKTIIAYHFLKMRQAYIYQQARGSAQPHVYPKDLQILRTEIPCKNVLRKFGEVIEPLYATMENHLKQNQELASLRDWLLPMLMNGQVTVGD